MLRQTDKPILLLIFFILFSLLFTVAIKAQELETVKVYYKPVVSWAPLMIAQEEGFFKKEGINLEFVKAQHTAEALILLIQGSLDVAFGPPTAGIYNAIREGKNIKFVAGTTVYKKDNDFVGIVVKDSLETIIDNNSLIKSLKGKKIGIPIVGSMPHFFLENILEKRGLSIEDVELAVMFFPVIKGAVEKGILDAGFLLEPFITSLRNKDGLSFISFGDEFSDTQAAFVIYGNNFLIKKPDVGLKFMVAYLKGCRQYNEGKTPRNIEVLGKYIKLDQDMLKKIDWPVLYPEGIGNIDILRKYQDWIIEKKYLTEGIDVDSMVEGSFIERAGQIIDNSKKNR